MKHLALVMIRVSYFAGTVSSAHCSLLLILEVYILHVYILYYYITILYIICIYMLYILYIYYMYICIPALLF